MTQSDRLTMSSALQKAKRRKTIALVFFAIFAADVIFKLAGITRPDYSRAPNLDVAWFIEFWHYFTPFIFFGIGYFFWSSHKELLLQAEYEEKAAPAAD